MPSIQQSAALALGRLANYSDDLAEAVVGNEILPQLVYSLSEQNRSGSEINKCSVVFFCVATNQTQRTTCVRTLGSMKGRYLRLGRSSTPNTMGSWGKLINIAARAGRIILFTLVRRQPCSQHRPKRSTSTYNSLFSLLTIDEPHFVAKWREELAQASTTRDA